ncbi:hypothetical protein R9C00_16300 [Flammeovirgaceae bacterium SG7u.111]|nr:hypothetical protein [Flammeovirgaceae bacterium SG7u.132]WPO33265.1 hypothetical protein R9C00_16300 [Flammeovirgaceae bacterium SG7u.111]
MFQLTILHFSRKVFFTAFLFFIGLFAYVEGRGQEILPEAQLDIYKQLKVRTLMIRMRTFRGNTHDPSSDYTIQYAFDTQGRIKEVFQSFTHQPQTLSRVYQYFNCEDHGLIRYFKNSRLEEIKLVTFDQYCRQASENFYDPFGKNKRKVIHTYQADGRPKSTFYLYEEAELNNHVVFKYENGMESSKTYGTDGLLKGEYTKFYNEIGLVKWERDDMFNEIREYEYYGPYCIKTKYTNSGGEVINEDYYRYLFDNIGLIKIRESQSVSTLPGPDLFTVEQFYYTFY